MRNGRRRVKKGSRKGVEGRKGGRGGKKENEEEKRGRMFHCHAFTTAKNGWLVYHISSLIFLHSSSIVLPFQSIPGETKGWERKGEGGEKGENRQVQAIPGTQFCVKCLYSIVSENLRNGLVSNNLDLPESQQYRIYRGNVAKHTTFSQPHSQAPPSFLLLVLAVQKSGRGPGIFSHVSHIRIEG